MQLDQIVTFLSTVPIFHDLPSEELEQLARSAELREFVEGELIEVQEEQDSPLFVFVEGEFQIVLHDEGIGLETELTRLYPGDYLGAAAVITGRFPPGVVRAVLPGRAIVLHRDALERLMSESPSFARSLCKALAALVQWSLEGVKGTRFAQLQSFPGAESAARLLPARIANACRSIVVQHEGDRVTVAMVDPSDTSSRAFIGSVLRDHQIEFVAISQDDFERNGRKLIPGGAEPVDLETPFGEVLFRNDQGELQQLQDSLQSGRLVRLLTAAIRSGASDIHIEPFEAGSRTRLRIDGRMFAFEEGIEPAAFRQLATRIKVLAELDTTNIRLPQDGRFMIEADGHRVEFRVSVTPCHGGDKLVLRLIAANKFLENLSNLVLPATLERFARSQFLQNRSGLILVTGPTGAGKTTTLYAALNSLIAHDSALNIVTIEDPVEYDLPFATQIQVNRDIGFDFARILRTVLRQDPDVILVGEIRDPESAALATEAATTGHLVLSSMHTYTALESIIRLRDLRVESYLVGAALKAVLTQQLVPRLAPGYTEPVPSDDPALGRLRELGVLDSEFQGTLLRGRDTEDGPAYGERGRVALFEMLAVRPDLRRAMERSAALGDLEECTDETCYSPFNDYARYLLSEGLVAPARIAAVLPGATDSLDGHLMAHTESS